MRLIFAGVLPDWVRVYTCNASGHAELLKDLRPVREGLGESEYLDSAVDIEGQSARIYAFWRAVVLAREHAPER